MQYERVSSLAFSDFTQLISLGELKTHQKNGILEFSVPGYSNFTTSFSVEKIVDTPEDGFVWMGKSTSNSGGYAIFREKEGMKSALFEINNAQYEIIPLSTTHQALVKPKKNFEIGGCDLQVPSDITTTDPTCEYQPNYNTCPALIDVLLVVDSTTAREVKANYGKLEYFFWSAEHVVNFAFWNSDIPNKEINVNWVEATEQIADSSNNLGETLLELKKYDLINNLRNNNNADVVFLVTNQMPNFGNSAGKVEAIGPMESAAFGVVTKPGFFGEQIFAHELGHILGCRHNWGDDDTEVCAHGHRHWTLVPPFFNEEFGYGYTWRTLLTTWLQFEDFLYNYDDQLYLVENRGTILHYSNPEVNYLGNTTGSPGPSTEDNAQQIRNAGCDVANFRIGSTPTVNIISSINCTDPGAYTAIVTPPGNPNAQGQPPYDYTWHWSLDGVFNNSVFTNNLFGTGANASLAHPSCIGFFVRVTVSSPANGGVYFSKILKINLSDYGCPCDSLIQPPIDRSVKETTLESEPVWSIQPNPAHDLLLVNCNSATCFPSNYTIIDSKGTTVQSGNFSQQTGSILHIAHLPNGIYHIRIVAEGKLQNIKFIKI